MLTNTTQYLLINQLIIKFISTTTYHNSYFTYISFTLHDQPKTQPLIINQSLNLQRNIKLYKPRITILNPGKGGINAKATLIHQLINQSITFIVNLLIIDPLNKNKQEPLSKSVTVKNKTISHT